MRTFISGVPWPPKETTPSKDVEGEMTAMPACGLRQIVRFNEVTDPGMLSEARDVRTSADSAVRPTGCLNEAVGDR